MDTSCGGGDGCWFWLWWKWLVSIVDVWWLLIFVAMDEEIKKLGGKREKSIFYYFIM